MPGVPGPASPAAGPADDREGSLEPEERQEQEPIWSIYARRADWPELPDRIFLPDAVDQLSDALWGSEDVDLQPHRDAIDTIGEPEERVGVLWTMVNLFTRLLVGNAMTTFAQPSTGGRGEPMAAHRWTAGQVTLAVAEGTVALGDHDGTPHDHWVFLDRVEFDLLMEIHSPAGAPPHDLVANLLRRHDRLAGIVLDNLAAIAGTPRTTLMTRAGVGLARTGDGADPTPAELDRLFAGARRVLGYRHQLALTERAAGWLLARFDEDGVKPWRYNRKILREMSIPAFDRYLTDALFDDAWKMATEICSERAEKGRRSQKP
ncbi:hypothetical protein ACVWZA_000555 [Sphingomonas sp. UYAg733]